MSSHREDTVRDVIFISHANPEDNDFTVWLGARLSAAGYETWSDITRLKGGEYFWQDIQAVIQDRAVKVIVVATVAAISKQGVLDEIQVAVDTERTINDQTFVIPVVYKPINFKTDTPVQIRRKNAIDFTKNWADGLAMLLERLAEDNVPKKSDLSNSMTQWHDAFSEYKNIVKEEPELLQSNWFEIQSLPETLNFYGIVGPMNYSDIKTLSDSINFPTYPFLRLVASFATYPRFQEACIAYNTNTTAEYRVPTVDFINGTAQNGPGCQSRDARNMVSNLVRQSWDAFMRGKGLKPYNLSDHSTVWWFPENFNTDNKVFFQKICGKKTWCQLVGKYRQYRWHFGLRALPVVSPHSSRLVIVPHVIFSTENDVLIESKSVMHRMRRSACKRWYNKVWRDRLSGALSWLSDGAESLSLPCGDLDIKVSSRPYIMESSISINLEEPEEVLNATIINVEEDDDFLSEEVTAPSTKPVLEEVA